MKRIGILILCLSFAKAGLSQMRMDYNHDKDYPQKMPAVFKLAPLGILSGPLPLLTAEYDLIYETPIEKKQSLQFGVGIIGKGIVLRIAEKQMSQPYNPLSFLVKGVKFDFAYKFFLPGKRRYAPKGMYAGPLVNFSTGGIGQTYDYMMRDRYIGFTNFSMNLIFGQQLMRRSARGFVLEYYGGFGYKKNVLINHLSATYSVPYKLDPSFYTSSFNVVFGVNVGWSFCKKDVNGGY